MTSPIDLEPAARRLAELVQSVPAHALSDPTPCAAYTVGDLLDHVAGSVAAFRAAAVKDPLPGGASGDASRLPPDGPGLDAVFSLVQQFRAAGIEGLFGPPVPVASDAPLLEQVLGAAGRDPRWTSPNDSP